MSEPSQHVLTKTSAVPQPVFSIVGYPERRREILALRRAAYAASGKCGPDNATEENIDPRDFRAANVIAEVEGRIVASVRLTPPLPGPILQPSCALRGPTDQLPAHSDFVEASWGCIHSEFQGQGLLWQLSAHMLVAADTFGRPYLLIGSDRQIWRHWQRCGFRKTGVTYRGTLSGNEYFVVTLNLNEVLAGRGIDPKLRFGLRALRKSRPRLGHR